MQIIKNSLGYPIARIRKTGNREEIYNIQGAYLGYYDINSNKTYDSLGRLVGTGNLNASLITSL